MDPLYPKTVISFLNIQLIFQLGWQTEHEKPFRHINDDNYSYNFYAVDLILDCGRSAEL